MSECECTPARFCGGEKRERPNDGIIIFIDRFQTALSTLYNTYIYIYRLLKDPGILLYTVHVLLRGVNVKWSMNIYYIMCTPTH